MAYLTKSSICLRFSIRALLAEVKTGVRQECLLSPLLFLMVLDWVLKNAYEGKRLGLQWIMTQRLEDLDYADDLCLLTH